jgi:hypothetical protein
MLFMFSCISRKSDALNFFLIRIWKHKRLLRYIYLHKLPRCRGRPGLMIMPVSVTVNITKSRGLLQIRQISWRYWMWCLTVQHIPEVWRISFHIRIIGNARIGSGIGSGDHARLDAHNLDITIRPWTPASHAGTTSDAPASLRSDCKFVTGWYPIRPQLLRNCRKAPNTQIETAFQWELPR